MDFTKFMSFLVNKALWFNRVDTYDDPFEGKLPLKVLQQHKDEMGSDPTTSYDHFRKYTYTNCWYISDSESAAMWKLYAKSEEAVAIQTTYEKLHKMMPSECRIGEITYIDYKNDSFSTDASFSGFMPSMYKRKAFAHEKELRTLIGDMHGGLMLKPDSQNTYIIDPNAKNEKLGISVPLQPTELVEGIYVAPLSAQWFKDLVVEISRSYGFGEDSIFSSELDENPY